MTIPSIGQLFPWDDCFVELRSLSIFISALLNSLSYYRRLDYQLASKALELVHTGNRKHRKRLNKYCLIVWMLFNDPILSNNYFVFTLDIFDGPHVSNTFVFIFWTFSMIKIYKTLEGIIVRWLYMTCRWVQLLCWCFEGFFECFWLT